MARSILDQIEQSLSPTKIGIQEFSESSDWCNKHLYPRQLVLLKLIFLEELTGEEEDVLDYWITGGRNGTEISISPNIRERIQFCRDNGFSHFKEIDLIGGRRSSKGFMTGIVMAKICWDVLNLQDPGEYYGIDPEKDIYFSCVAGSESQAREFQYKDFSTTIETCKAFEPYLVKSLETEIRIATPADLVKINQAKARGNRIQKDIAKLRGKALAANAGTLRGSTTMAIVVDECAHMIPGESKASAEEVYKAATPSLDQFGIDGIIFLNSSPYTKVGLFYERVQEAFKVFDPKRDTQDIENGNGDPTLLAFQYPSWGLFQNYQGHTTKYHSIPHFKVITASPDWDENEKDKNGQPWWSDVDQKAIQQARRNEAANPESYKVERRGKFAEVVNAFLNPGQVDRMFMGIPTEWSHGVNGEVYPVYTPLSTNWGDDANNLHRYKFHLDPSSTTAGFGFAIGHMEIFANAQGVEEECVVFDLLKRWNPQDFGGVIRWSPILTEIMGYAEIFRPFEITMDQFSSAQPIQDLQERLNTRNITCRVYERTATNELNWKRWQVFKTSLYQGRLHAPFDTPDCHLASQELKFLQEKATGGKYPRIDRQEIGPVQTRDVADCAAELVHALIGNSMVNRMRDRLSNSSLLTGAQGGYGIGSGPQGGPGPAGISEFYSSRERAGHARSAPDPARGVLGRSRGRTNRSKGRF